MMCDFKVLDEYIIFCTVAVLLKRRYLLCSWCVIFEKSMEDIL